MFSRKQDKHHPVAGPNRLAAVDVEPLAADDATALGPAVYRSSAQSMVSTGRVAPTDETVISSDLTIVGNVISKGRVRLEGTIEGDMRCASLEVGETGSVTGTIIAEDVAVYGKVAGTVRGRSVRLFSTAHVEGDIFHRGIGIEMGTHYDGRLKWSDNPVEDAADLTAPGNGLDRSGLGLSGDSSLGS
jgi:cytoskeletal protein CcmA (bactofilin family)